MTAKQVHEDWIIYCEYIGGRGLPDDTNEITVEALEDFVNSKISEEEKTNIRSMIWGE